MSILSQQMIADTLARVLATVVDPAPKPAVRFPRDHRQHVADQHSDQARRRGGHRIPAADPDAEHWGLCQHPWRRIRDRASRTGRSLVPLPGGQRWCVRGQHQLRAWHPVIVFLPRRNRLTTSCGGWPSRIEVGTVPGCVSAARVREEISASRSVTAGTAESRSGHRAASSALSAAGPGDPDRSQAAAGRAPGHHEAVDGGDLRYRVYPRPDAAR